jgi:hypothetical protein
MDPRYQPAGMTDWVAGLKKKKRTLKAQHASDIV